MPEIVGIVLLREALSAHFWTNLLCDPTKPYKMNKAWLAVALVFVGCCSNVVFLELLIKPHPGSGNIITFAQVRGGVEMC